MRGALDLGHPMRRLTTCGDWACIGGALAASWLLLVPASSASASSPVSGSGDDGAARPAAPATTVEADAPGEGARPSAMGLLCLRCRCAPERGGARCHSGCCGCSSCWAYAAGTASRVAGVYGGGGSDSVDDCRDGLELHGLAGRACRFECIAPSRAVAGSPSPAASASQLAALLLATLPLSSVRSESVCSSILEATSKDSRGRCLCDMVAPARPTAGPRAQQRDAEGVVKANRAFGR